MRCYYIALKGKHEECSSIPLQAFPSPRLQLIFNKFFCFAKNSEAIRENVLGSHSAKTRATLGHTLDAHAAACAALTAQRLTLYTTTVVTCTRVYNTAVDDSRQRALSRGSRRPGGDGGGRGPCISYICMVGPRYSVLGHAGRSQRSSAFRLPTLGVHARRYPAVASPACSEPHPSPLSPSVAPGREGTVAPGMCAHVSECKPSAHSRHLIG